MENGLPVFSLFLNGNSLHTQTHTTQIYNSRGKSIIMFEEATMIGKLVKKGKQEGKNVRFSSQVESTGD